MPLELRKCNNLVNERIILSTRTRYRAIQVSFSFSGISVSSLSFSQIPCDSHLSKCEIPSRFVFHAYLEEVASVAADQQRVRGPSQVDFCKAQLKYFPSVYSGEQSVDCKKGVTKNSFCYIGYKNSPFAHRPTGICCDETYVEKL